MEIKPWVFLGKDFVELPENYYAFVYEITNTQTGKKYIGKKLFFFRGKKKVTLKNGKKKTKKCLVESDWRTYFGSSSALDQDVSNMGKDLFIRRILHLCRSKSEASYLEAYEQFRNHVLLDDAYHNGWIMVRVRKEHLVKHREKLLDSLSLA